LANLKNKNFALFLHVKHFSNVTFYHLSNIMQISAIISTMQNINILLHGSFTVLSTHKAWQLSKVGLSTIKHQHSKISQHGQKPLEPKTHKNVNCLHEFAHKKNFQNVHRLYGHTPGDVFSAG